MSLNLASFLDAILVYAPGCPGPTLRRELIKSAQRFCRETGIVTRDITFFTDVAVTATDLMPLMLPGETPIKVKSLAVEGRDINPLSFDELRRRVPQYLNIQASRPTIYYARRETEVRLFPVPDDVYSISAVVSVAPSETAEFLPDELGGLWRDAIVGGTLSRLCMVPGQSYTSQDMAAMGSAWWYSGIEDARIQANNSFGRSARVTQRPFA